MEQKIVPGCKEWCAMLLAEQLIESGEPCFPGCIRPRGVICEDTSLSEMVFIVD